MEIKTNIEMFGGVDALSVRVVDCEGFSVQEYIELSDTLNYGNQLIDSLKLMFALLDMDKEQIEDELRSSGLI